MQEKSCENKRKCSVLQRRLHEMDEAFLSLVQKRKMQLGLFMDKYLHHIEQKCSQNLVQPLGNDISGRAKHFERISLEIKQRKLQRSGNIATRRQQIHQKWLLFINDVDQVSFEEVNSLCSEDEASNHSSVNETDSVASFEGEYEDNEVSSYLSGDDCCQLLHRQEVLRQEAMLKLHQALADCSNAISN